MQEKKYNCEDDNICFITGININDEDLFMDVSGKELLFIQMFEKYLVLCSYSEIVISKDKTKSIANYQPDIAESLIALNGFKYQVEMLEIFIDMLIFYNDLKVKCG